MPEGVQRILDANESIKDAFIAVKGQEFTLEAFIPAAGGGPGVIGVIQQQIGNVLDDVDTILGEIGTAPTKPVKDILVDKVNFIKKDPRSLIPSFWKPYVGVQAQLMASQYGDYYIDNGLADSKNEVQQIFYEIMRDLNNDTLDPNILCGGIYNNLFNITLDPESGVIEEQPHPLEPETTKKMEEFSPRGSTESSSTYSTPYKNDNQSLNGASEIVKALNYSAKKFKSNKTGSNIDYASALRSSARGTIAGYLTSINSPLTVTEYIAQNTPAKIRQDLEPFLKD